MSDSGGASARRDWQARFLEEHVLPATYLDTAARFFDPLARLLSERAAVAGRSLLVGVNGCQGSGKSTLCDYLCASLSEDFALGAIALSLDDFYLTHAQRQALARDVHPLLATRGVPGTHDMRLLGETLAALRGPADGTGEVAVPRFDKAVDDRMPTGNWTRCAAPVDVVILEGWCLGARSQSEDELRRPCNALERGEDADCRWRRYINEQLRRHYEALNAQIDIWVMLAAPGFAQVLEWRSEQEAKLRRARGGRGGGLMDEAQLARFVAHFERHTRQCLEQLPGEVDVLLSLDAQRRIVAARGLPGRESSAETGDA